MAGRVWLLALLVGLALACSGDVRPRVREVTGRVGLSPSHGGSPRAARVDDRLEPGDVLTTEADGHAQLELAGGTQIDVEPLSSLILKLPARGGAASTVMLQHGNLVATSSGAGVMVTIGTPFGWLKLGDHRAVAALGTENGIVVRIGVVTVELLDGRTLALEPGKQLTVDGLLLTLASPGSLPPIEPMPSAKPVRPPKSRPKAATALPPKPTTAAPKAAAAPDYDGWRRAIATGKGKEVEAELEDYLTRATTDTEAWSLLADCRRKRGAYREAVEAYAEVTDHGKPDTANRARFLAASLLADNLGEHREAASLLATYLEETLAKNPLAAIARMRLARALLAAGERERAQRELERVVREAPDSPEAEQARALLGAASAAKRP